MNADKHRWDRDVKTIIVGFLAMVFGCNDDARQPMDQGKPISATVESIGPQFWKYDLNGYQRVDHDVVYGLGGRWISVRYLRSKGVSTTKEAVTSQIVASLLQDGWEKAARSENFTVARIWESSPDDFCFKRNARESEGANWFFTQTIHISDDARTICIYAEVGW
jgi:hypothetical protein